MKKIYKNKKNTLPTWARAAAACGVLFLGSCSEEFLKPDPLSFYEPAATFSTESGLMSAMAICDRHLKLYYAHPDHNEVLMMGTEYIFSDMMVASATDKKSMLCDVANMLTPTTDDQTLNDLDRTNSLWYFWQETYKGILYANTIIQFVDEVEDLDEAIKNTYKGRAYFHRAFRYMALVFQYGDVPLVTKVLAVPKQNYRSTKRDAILDMITADMEKAVEWVPDQKDMNMIGMVNKGACRMLLAKCYLATGEYAKAKEQTDILIDQSGYALVKSNFGTFNDGGEPRTWPIERNVIWDLHRPENKLIAANTEVIMGLPNRGADAESFVKMITMRVLYPFYFDNDYVKAKDGKRALMNYARNNTKYDPKYDYARAFGRGVATFRPTYWSTHSLWALNGTEDNDDLRHNASVGNWVCMDSLRVNNKDSKHFGEYIALFDDKGELLCTDTLRRWYDVPHYKLYLEDVVKEAQLSANDFRGATNGGIADWYQYRLAEAYLLRAEAKFYLNPSDPTIKDDLNELRSRAQCSQLYTGAVTIGDIMNERARELYWEEWRNVELTRVSLCLARSGKPDEWGNTYSLSDFDKQTGTDKEGGSYWYQRVVRCGGMYNSGVTISISSTGLTSVSYTMDKKNIYWPIPYAAITANSKGALAQNVGYDGYDPATPKWETWQEAVADEEKTE
ncbi:MAG: RagB/SusD family nutrient uptake outer membrane protein [Prevotellaceae bacterium]|jgi:tetratricopeptide (TPR) repeat protein|nr:RagB/SusD family nutrient uptake outer membrane protein [Prevotellaceae bacterium]